LIVDFDSFAARELDGLLRYATVLTGERELARDLVQDVLLKAYRRWAMIAATEYPRAYVRTMVTRAYLSWRRSWATRHVLLAFDGPGKQFDEPSTGDHAHAIAERDALWQRLATLPRRQRSVLVLRYYERLADAEIAEVLGCSAVTVRGYASRALATLRLGEAAQRDLATTAVSTTAANLRELR
jgi:RNA polymerase sigma-70 factor (sigma-E family)